jgi:hypothetical protein
MTCLACFGKHTNVERALACYLRLPASPRLAQPAQLEPVEHVQECRPIPACSVDSPPDSGEIGRIPRVLREDDRSPYRPRNPVPGRVPGRAATNPSPGAKPGQKETEL